MTSSPHRTVPEVARLLRPGGLFAFCHLSPIVELCWPDDAERAWARRWPAECIWRLRRT